MKSFIKKRITNPIMVFALATLCCLLWGSAFPVIKIGYSILNIESFDYSSQILFAGIRFTLAGIFTVLIGSAMSRSFLAVKPRSFYKVGVLALFQTVLQYLFFYIGLANTTGTKSSILDSTSVFFSVLIAGLIIRQEKLSISKLSGCIIGFIGVVIINMSAKGIDTDMSIKGEGFIILSALSYAISSILIKYMSVGESPVALSGYQFILGGAVMIISGFLMGGELSISSFKAVALLIYLALLSAVAYTIWGILLKYNDISRVTVYAFMTPVFGCLLSALLLRENVNDSVIRTLISLIFVCAGIYLVNKNKKSNQALGETL